jgi:hypothetical protein
MKPKLDADEDEGVEHEAAPLLHIARRGGDNGDGPSIVGGAKQAPLTATSAGREEIGINIPATSAGAADDGEDAAAEPTCRIW